MCQYMIDEFESKYLDFSMKICNTEGIDEELLSELFDIMDKLHLHYVNSETIPKRLAGLFVDISESLIGYSSYYKDEEVQQDILEVSCMLAHKAREICFN